MAVIVFVQARLKAIPIALVQPKSKVTGSQIPTLQITFHAANGSAAEVNQ